MGIGNFQVGNYKNITASGNVKSSEGAILGFYVNSTTTGTIQFYDDAATGTTTPITGVITPAIGWNPLPLAFTKGLNAVIGGSALNTTISWV